MPPRANSDMFALARISAPALRILATVKASADGCEFLIPTLPPVVGRAAVLKVSLRTTGTQCSEPAPDGLALYCRSISAAISIDLGLTVMMARSAGPFQL